MLMKMLADMVGMTPETLQSEMEGVMTLIKESRESLARIELNQQDAAREMTALRSQLEKASGNDGHDNHGGDAGS